MLRHFIIAPALAGCALLSAGALAQSERASSLPSYNLVQLSAWSSQVEPKDFRAQSAAIRSCGEAVKLARESGRQVTRERFVHPSELPPPLRPILRDVLTGQAAPVLSEGVLGEDSSALHVLVVCNR